MVLGLRVSLSLLLFVAGFGVTSNWVGSKLPERLKLEWFQSIEDQVDVAFIGSSHVFRQFDPAIFDAARAVGERQLRSVNLGAPGMTLAEEMFLVGRLLDAQPKNLKWLVVEALPADLGMKNEELNDFGKRRVEWHDLDVTALLVEEACRADLPWRERSSLIRRHLEHWWWRSVFLGRGFEWFQSSQESPLEAEGASRILGRNRDGYVPLEMSTADAETVQERRDFLQNPRLLWGARPHLVGADDGGPPSQLLVAFVERMEQRAAVEGVGILWWLHPNLDRFSGWRRLKTGGKIQRLIAFDDIERYPEFYKLRWRFDPYHLTRKGSEMMTTTFALEFLAQTTEQTH